MQNMRRQVICAKTLYFVPTFEKMKKLLPSLYSRYPFRLTKGRVKPLLISGLEGKVSFL